MAKVILHPIGTALEKALDPAEATKNAAHLAGLEAALDDKRDEVRAGWGEKYVDRVHAKGKLTTWERIERLKDDGHRGPPRRHPRQLRPHVRPRRARPRPAPAW